MSRILNIVSGTTVVDVMKRENLPGKFLVWQDFLHEGPVPGNFSLPQLSKIRAYFLNDYKYMSLDQALCLFEYRNDILKNHKKYKKIILWFEKDLYDQLQLLQILDWFESNLSKDTRLNLVLTDRHFTDYSSHELQAAIYYNKVITNKDLKLSKKVWSSFSDTSPLSWFKLLDEADLDRLSLKNSVQRLLEEYPNTINGLSRTEHQALLTISKGEGMQKKEIFIESQKEEEAPFIADIIFWKILDEFIEHKLIIVEIDNSISITELGEEVLSAKKNWISIKDIDHWIGGVYLTNDNLWCWNIQEQTIAKYYYSKTLSTLIPVKQTLELA